MARTLWDALGEIEDTRGRKGRQYRLKSVLGIAIAAMLAGANDLRAIYRWGQRLRPEALPLFDITNGKPRVTRHITTSSIRWTPMPSRACLVFAMANAAPGHMATDAKTLKGSRRLDAKAIHVLSAFSTELGAVIGDLVVRLTTPARRAFPDVCATRTASPAASRL